VTTISHPALTPIKYALSSSDVAASIIHPPPCKAPAINDLGSNVVPYPDSILRLLIDVPSCVKYSTVKPSGFVM